MGSYKKAQLPGQQQLCYPLSDTERSRHKYHSPMASRQCERLDQVYSWKVQPPRVL